MHIDLSIVYAVSGMVAFALNGSISPNNEDNHPMKIDCFTEI